MQVRSSGHSFPHSELNVISIHTHPLAVPCLTSPWPQRPFPLANMPPSCSSENPIRLSDNWTSSHDVIHMLAPLPSVIFVARDDAAYAVDPQQSRLNDFEIMTLEYAAVNGQTREDS